MLRTFSQRKENETHTLSLKIERTDQEEHHQHAITTARGVQTGDELERGRQGQEESEKDNVSNEIQAAIISGCHTIKHDFCLVPNGSLFSKI